MDTIRQAVDDTEQIFHRLYENYVPQQGQAQTINGELIRAVARLTYEYLNNGNCNAAEHDEDDWDDDDRCYYGTATIAPFYQNFLSLIKIHVPEARPVLAKVRDIITSSDSVSQFSDENRNAYKELRCIVTVFVSDRIQNGIDPSFQGYRE